MAKERMFNLENFAKGALSEQMNGEFEKVMENIYDPNSAADKPRKVTVSITFKPSKNRQTAAVTIQAKSLLVPVAALETNILIDKDLKTNEIKAAEIGNQIAGQVEMEIEEEPPKGSHVIDLKAQSNK